MNFPDRVHVVEVGPRDGLQSLPDTYPTAVKVEMVETSSTKRFSDSRRCWTPRWKTTGMRSSTPDWPAWSESTVAPSFS